MSIYLVTYDLLSPGQKYEKVLEKIKGHKSWARLSESSYAIETSLTPDQIVGELRPVMDTNDHVYVIALHRPYSGYGPKDVNDWLESRLTSC